MTSEELAGAVEEFIRQTTARVLGPGRAQYELSDCQAFEHMSPLELIQLAREEAQDGAAYMAMLDIQLARMAARLAEVSG